MTLATFVHISDLHFGLIDSDTFDAEACQLWAMIPKFDGLLGHRYSSLVLLERFFGGKLKDDLPLLIVTGDITSKGHEEEFRIANDYLGDELEFPDHSSVGLATADWKNWKGWAIPGNHDHWPGHNTVLGRPTDAFKNCFMNLPAITELQIPSTSYRIRFLRIDTDRDVSYYWLDRFNARGCFVSELKALSEMIRDLPPASVTVLCLHHSQAKAGYSLAIDIKSRDALNNFIIDNEVSVLLSGHIHNPPLVKASRPLMAPVPGNT